MSPPVGKTVGVIGTGVIGASWIALFLAKGLKVFVTDPDPDAPAKVSTFLHDAWPGLVIAGLAPGASLSNYEFVEEIDEFLTEIDFIQENSLGGFKFRRKLLARLDQKTPPGTVICSSQLGIPSELVCECNHRPGRILIGHPTSLPHLLPVVEVTANRETQINHVVAAIGFYRSLGGMPLLVRGGSTDLDGNRLRAALLAETYGLVHRGLVSVDDIGVVMTGLQWAFAGPFRTNGFSTMGTFPNICNTTCIREKCNALQSECHRPCECAEAQDIIDCNATSCWNEIYSCEFGVSVSGLVYSCPDVNLDQIPFWPAPDNAPGRYTYNVGKITKKQLQIENQAEVCVYNVTKLGQLSTAQERTDYLQACLCCEMSAIVASIWDTCPNTKPTLITANFWSENLLGPLDWDACAPYLQQYDRAGTLGFGAAAAGGAQNFYEPGSIPKNGTGMLTNTGGVISTPVSGSSFTWTLGSTTHPLTAAVSSTATLSATRECTATVCQGAQKTGGEESIAAVHSRLGILLAGTLIGLWAAWVGFCM